MLVSDVPVLHWWERGKAMREMWSMLVFLPDRVRAVNQEEFSEAELDALALLVRGAIVELKKLC